MRNPRCEQMCSALLPTSDVTRQRSSLATSITARAVGLPAEGKALRPQHSPRVVFFELARFRAVGQKASLGTPQAGARPMTRPRGPQGRPRAFEAAATSTTPPRGNNESTRGAPGGREAPLQQKAAGELTSPADFPPIPCRGWGRYRTSPWRHPAGRPGRPSRRPKYGRKRPCRRHPTR
jgi:hypothetical protein